MTGGPSPATLVGDRRAVGGGDGLHDGLLLESGLPTRKDERPHADGQDTVHRGRPPLVSRENDRARSEERMRYLLLISADEEHGAAKAMEAGRSARSTPGSPTWSGAACWRRTSGLHPSRDRDDRAAARRRGPAHRRPVRRGPRAGRRVRAGRLPRTSTRRSRSRPATPRRRSARSRSGRCAARGRRGRARCSRRRSGEDWGRLVATLIGVTGDWDLAEECRAGGVRRGAADLAPRRGPGRAARLADHHRPQPRGRPDPPRPGRRGQAARRWPPSSPSDRDVDLDALDSGIADDRLRLIFTCCHPALRLSSRR